ncbi:hypothetical protein [Nocardia mangyaensis]|uniref:hypothetical protein n=1 Tax=Nocardia mangyaensis TaxID=2213200 RepID=UPI002674CB81|nr:hypothetical protein [Nocardia mangyaensis]MDO3651053.1 hypothetical protein [Nocardia mangyaensis]
MILTDRVARAVAAGDVVQVFRRWAKPRVRVGTRLHTSAGVVEVVGLEPIAAHDISDADAHTAGERDAEAVTASFRGSPDDPVYRIAVRYAGPDERVESSSRADLSARDVDEITAALARLDRASRSGPWTAEVLAAIASHPRVRAAEVAVLLGRDKESLKLDVRKLKNLGLTWSLDIGYEISPRGAAFLRASNG